MTISRRTRALFTCLVASASACGGGDDAAPVPLPGTPCDPLAAYAEQVTVGPTLAVGKDANGTLYVVTSDLRFFESSDGALVERDIFGPGEEHGAVAILDAYLTDDSAVNVEVDASSGVPRMGLRPLDGHTTFDIGTDGTELTVVDASAIANVPATRLIGPFVQRAARLDDGRELWVIDPVVPDDPAHFRLFFGTAKALLERTNLGYVREPGVGNYDDIELDIDGERVAARLQNTGLDLFATGTITIAGLTHTTEDLGGAASSRAFRCFTK